MHNTYSSKKERSKHLTKIFLLLAPLMILIIVFTLAPMIHTFFKSIEFFPYKSNKTIVQHNFGNYKSIWSDTRFKYAVINSTLVLFLGTSISLVLAFVFALMVEFLISKTVKSFVLSLIYSQFFISTFAVGIAFTIFFGSKNLFFRLIGSKYSFTSGNNRLPIWIYYVLFQIWRSLPFNLILIASAINRANIKYGKQQVIDNLNIWQKIRFIYIKEVATVSFAIIFTNFIFASLLLPQALLEDTFDVDIENAHTLTSYTIKFIGGGTKGSLEFEKGYAAAFFSFAYLVLLLVITLALRPTIIKRFIRFIQRKIAKSKSKQLLKKEVNNAS
ncbi:sugar ABC transporter permease [Mycoplasmopsis mucosicanis]|uniref:Sugar ABC transporter permease n=1 Tax=Mycoplasmopsis mucosicanis TaxID=458208 RepID=A0A507SHH9_9BACT|nr:sugar ABC transporter permease [Mycoplasmopsis mucosicanis]TQC51309.1 sugar ABC transporter permease [Mycoplasmopsis mucosicanis]